LRRGQSDAVKKALQLISDQAADKQQRLECIRTFGEVQQPDCVPVLLDLIRSTKDTAMAKAALKALQAYDQRAIGETVVAALCCLPADAQTAAFELLGSRPVWALTLLEALDAKKLRPADVPQDVVRRIKLYSDSKTAGPFQKDFGGERVPTTAEMQGQIHRLAGVLAKGSGNPYDGQRIFTTTCAVCHTLFTQGGHIGPDLTTYKRDDIDNMLLNIVNPSAEIREGYENYFVTTKDGRTLAGFLADKDNRVVVLRGVDGENTVLPQEQIVQMKSAGISLMPEGLLDALNEQQVRDLFAYLRSTQPLVR
jgi:putative heme-binding domain-containing protein